MGRGRDPVDKTIPTIIGGQKFFELGKEMKRFLEDAEALERVQVFADNQPIRRAVARFLCASGLLRHVGKRPIDEEFQITPKGREALARIREYDRRA